MRIFVKKIITIIIFSLMLTTLLANPAPISIELFDLVLIILPCLLVLVSMRLTAYYFIDAIEFPLMISILLYFCYLSLSMLMGLIDNVPILNILRAVGPYINFLPLLIIGFIPARWIDLNAIIIVLIIIGCLQATYQLYLFYISSPALNTLSVLRARITLLDPRATLPIVLSASILPLAYLFTVPSTPIVKKIMLISFNLMLVFIGLFGSIATLTRSIVLSIFVGWSAFFILYIQHLIQENKFFFVSLLKKLTFSSAVFFAIFIVISFIPSIYFLEQGLLSRFIHTAASGSSADYSNGRIFEEWLPALYHWTHSGILDIFFGIGAGHSFIIASGEERTYIHNLLIYDLVYGGIFGFLASISLYFFTFKTLLIRAKQSMQIIYLALAALLVSLFFYGQLFAVHKGFAFNAMLFLITAFAMQKPKMLTLENISG